MHENNAIFYDPNLSLYRANTYTLLLSVAEKTFAFAVIHDQQMMACGLNLPLSELAAPEQLKELLASDFKSIVVGLPALALTLVPVPIFNDNHPAEIARMLDVKADEKVFVQQLDENNIVFYKTKLALVKLAERFDLKNITYDQCGWLKTIANSSPPGNNLYINISNGAASYLYYFLGTLRYHNAFKFSNEAELVYYTTFVSSELNIKPLYTYLILSGDISSGDKYMNRLAEFYPNISLNPLRAVTVSDELDAHNYLALSGLSLCGSLEEA